MGLVLSPFDSIASKQFFPGALVPPIQARHGFIHMLLGASYALRKFNLVFDVNLGIWSLEEPRMSCNSTIIIQGASFEELMFSIIFYNAPQWHCVLIPSVHRMFTGNKRLQEINV